MEKGGLVPDDLLNGIIDERLRMADCADGLHPRRVPAHAAPGRGLRAAWAPRRRHQRGVRAQHRGAARRSCCAGSPGAAGARPARPPTTSTTTRPSRRRALRQRRHEADPARGRQGDGGEAAPGGVRRAHRAPHRLLPRPLALPPRERLPPAGRGLRASCWRSSPAARPRPPARSAAREHQEVLAELQKMHRACTIVVETLADAGRGRGAGRDHEGAGHHRARVAS